MNDDRLEKREVVIGGPQTAENRVDELIDGDGYVAVATGTNALAALTAALDKSEGGAR